MFGYFDLVVCWVGRDLVARFNVVDFEVIWEDGWMFQEGAGKGGSQWVQPRIIGSMMIYVWDPWV